MSPQERGPKDFDEQDDDIRRMAGIIERLVQPRYPESDNKLNTIVLSCAGALCLMTLAIGGWGISTLISTREELAGVRVEMRNVVDRLDRLERKP